MSVNYAPYLRRRGWTEVWEYPGRSLLNLNKDFPSLAPFYSNWESKFQGGDALAFSRGVYLTGPVVCLLYVIFVHVGPKVMAERKAFDLRTPLRYWNLILAIFSFCGTVRVVPHLFYILYELGWDASICSPPAFTYGHGACGFWVMLFIYSKFFELMDTVFIVLRKRRLSFLHWYHHLTVLLYTWDAYAHEQPPGLYFIAMNYTVHAIMYFYYYLQATKRRPPSWAMIVTTLQITQMFIGIFITACGLYYAFNFPFTTFMMPEQVREPLKMGCYISKGNLYVGCTMYGTYLYLFAEFFVKKYLSSSHEAHAAAAVRGEKTGVDPTTLDDPATPTTASKSSSSNAAGPGSSSSATTAVTATDDDEAAGGGGATGGGGPVERKKMQ
eukprot:GHVU01194555.1.p1 GENE.GHVU01194555.1~~GHVU01194555.1.p1  ORF type:complete len:384 (-),score=58.48 GHVU01194555.1:431-1582(-)